MGACWCSFLLGKWARVFLWGPSLQSFLHRVLGSGYPWYFSILWALVCGSGPAFLVAGIFQASVGQFPPPSSPTSPALTERGCSLSFSWRRCKAQVGAAVLLMLLMLLWAGEAGGWCCCVRHVCWLKRSILFSASVLSLSHPRLQVPDCPMRVWLLTLNILWSRRFLSRDWRAPRRCQESWRWWHRGGWERVGGSAKEKGAKQLLKNSE